jgi:2-amino-4-hydroxy-6-hydroxymethyldihydropteridine diphosphokinase
MLSENLYLIALGSNRRHAELGSPTKIIEHAVAALEMPDISVFAESSAITSRPIGPSQRNFANAAVIIASSLAPVQLLGRLKQIETHFGRCLRGQPWRDRVLDLDIILWSGGIWSSDKPPLAIPHESWKNRHFVLQPASQIAANWRDPISGLSVGQLLNRYNRSKRVDQYGKQH